MTSNKCLDFGGGPYHSADTGILKRNFTSCGIGQFYTFC